MMKKKATANMNGTLERHHEKMMFAHDLTSRIFSGPPRDVMRIPRILNKLGEIWSQHNMFDMRLGQLLECINGVPLDWNIEDSQFEQNLETYYRRVLAEQQVKRDMNAKSRPRRRNTN